jgi:hypothetical protein
MLAVMDRKVHLNCHSLSGAVIGAILLDALHDTGKAHTVKANVPTLPTFGQE